MSVQLSLFSDEDSDPAVEDVEGLLLAGGALVRRLGTARISVLTDVGWRAEEIRSGMDTRGLAAELGEAAGGRCSVRSAFDPRLVDMAGRWSAGARSRIPAGFVLTHRRLRFWAVAAGGHDHAGYLLRVGPHDEHLHEAIGALLSAAGIPGAFLGVRAGGPAYRIVGSRRLARLRELAGRLPVDADPDCWP
ncbi:MAG: hypothetical protein H0T85_09235 [Geodermatophilaceae bacterium]|nr:hypothetical protein [Geodermatophilaceae bacterium]